MRPSFDEYFMEIAEKVRERSTCARPDRAVGAVLVIDNRAIAMGYNGAPSGMQHCTPETCVRTVLHVPSGEKAELCRAIHAEMNCLLQAARYGVKTEGATIYVTHQPCGICMRALYQAGIKRVVYRKAYPTNWCNDDFTRYMVIERR